MRITAERVSSFLSALPASSRIVIAYSGGMDSHVLLHVMARMRPRYPWRMDAIHINHHLQKQNEDWALHCRRTCRSLDVSLSIKTVDASNPGKEGLEGRARRLRYAAIQQCLGKADILLTAHHQDDQLETFLLQLFRGAGVLGLASMPPLRRFDPGWHGRPLLGFPRSALYHYAHENNLTWVEDPSNESRQMDRNFLRHEIMPTIKSRWPDVSTPVARTISIHADVQVLLDDVARQDLASCQGGNKNILVISELQRLTPQRQRNVLRYFIRTLALPIPGSDHLSHIMSDILASRRYSIACVKWRGAEARRYRGYLHIGPALDDFDSSVILPWRFNRPCVLQYGELTAREGKGGGLRKDCCANSLVEIRYRRGGERIRLPGHQHHHKIKKLFQGRGIPHWLREQVPFIYINDRLAMVAGLWIDAAFLAADDEDAWIIHWTRAADVLAFNV